jgi:GT2 family glycosyltransferase
MVKYDLTASIVLYRNDDSVKKAIASFLNSSLKIQLYLIDNSPTNILKAQLGDFLTDCRIDYLFNNKNIGYGAGHNIALEQSLDNAGYHLILNPDIEFGENVLEDIFGFMQSNKNVGQLMPKVLYENGELQKLCNLLPTPFDLLGRRFFLKYDWAKKMNDRYELKGFNYDRCINVPNLSGCFMFMRSSVLKKVGVFDKRYFMYMEDVDLTRRMHQVSETIFYPHKIIYHKYEKESYSNPQLLKYHIKSAISYFDKWGWIFDKEREQINQETLKRLATA